MFGCAAADPTGPGGAAASVDARRSGDAERRAPDASDTRDIPQAEPLDAAAAPDGPPAAEVADPLDAVAAAGVAVAEDTPETAAPTGACPGGYEAPAVAGTLDTAALTEASGLAASHRDPTLLWTHNDSGDGPTLYGLGTDGVLRARVHVTGSAAVDWEDVARATCPGSAGGDCLWVGDVGNNALNRSDLAIVVVAEPELPAPGADGPVELSVAAGWRFPVTYPGAPVDAEALLVAPAGDALWLVEKLDGASARLFRHPGPLADGVPAELELVTAFPAPGVPISKGRMVTGGDLHPSGTRVLLRTYTGTFEYRLGTAGDLAALATVEPLAVANGPITEPQGEAACYDAAGEAVWTLSEDPQSKGYQPLHHYACAR